MLLSPVPTSAKGPMHSCVCRSCHILLSKVLSGEEKTRQLKHTVCASLEAVYPRPSCGDGTGPAGELLTPQYEDPEHLRPPPSQWPCLSAKRALSYTDAGEEVQYPSATISVMGRA